MSYPEPATRHGFYSRKQAKLYSSTNPKLHAAMYETPDGKEVKVTTVSDSKNPGGMWDDYVYVGEVTNFLRKAKVRVYQSVCRGAD